MNTKNIWKYLMMLVVVLGTAFCLASCSDDDEEGEDGVSYDKELIGTWTSTESGNGWTETVTLTFEKNGKGKEHYKYVDEEENEEYDASFTWYTKGNTITLSISYEGKNETVSGTYSIKGKTLTFYNAEDGDAFTLTRK